MFDLQNLKGKFIVFEGGEGSGKTILTNRLYEDFKSQNIPVVKTHDPGGTECSQEIRKILLKKDSKINKYTEMLLYSAARSQLTSDIISPALKSGKTVICDRFYNSLIVYQGMLKKNDLSILKIIFDYTCDINPDIILLMDVDAETGLKRSYKVLEKDNVDESRFEDYGLIFHKKVNKCFLDLAYDDNYYLSHISKTRIINANKSLAYCYNKINEHLKEYSERLMNR